MERDTVRRLREVHRALLELRRGTPVVLAGAPASGHAERFVVLAAETVSPEALEELQAACGGAQLTLVVAGGRAAALAQPEGAPGAGSDFPMALHLGARPDAATILRLADPTLAAQAGDAGAPPAEMPDVAVAAVRLAKLARLLPAVVMARLRPGAGEDLLRVREVAVLEYPAQAAAQLVQAAAASVPLQDVPDARLVAFRPPDGGIEHIAIVIGRPEGAAAPLVRIHSECFTGDVLGSLRCDCGPQLHEALRLMRAEGAGVVLYMAQEGRGIGLVNKLRAYALQDQGLDTLDANRALGFRADERNFAPAAAMLQGLGLRRVRLLTNNPEKLAGLGAYGIEIAGREALQIAANGTNDAYLRTKADRFGHMLDG